MLVPMFNDAGRDLNRLFGRRGFLAHCLASSIARSVVWGKQLYGAIGVAA
jgi:hypothetical protein